MTCGPQVRWWPLHAEVQVCNYLGQVWLSTNYYRYESRNEGTRPARTKSGAGARLAHNSRGV